MAANLLEIRDEIQWDSILLPIIIQQARARIKGRVPENEPGAGSADQAENKYFGWIPIRQPNRSIHFTGHCGLVKGGAVQSQRCSMSVLFREKVVLGKNMVKKEERTFWDAMVFLWKPSPLTGALP